MNDALNEYEKFAAKQFDELKVRLGDIERCKESKEILRSLFESLDENRRTRASTDAKRKTRESTDEKKTEQHLARFAETAAFELIRNYATAYSAWVVCVKLDMDLVGGTGKTKKSSKTGGGSHHSKNLRLIYEEMEPAYLELAQKNFYFLTPSFLSLLKHTNHSEAASKLRRLLNANVLNMHSRLNKSKHKSLSLHQLSQEQMHSISELNLDWEKELFPNCIAFRNERTGHRSSYTSKWYSLLDSVALAFAELHGGEGVVLKALRANAEKQRGIKPGDFASKANPDGTYFPDGSLTLSKVSNAAVCWDEIYANLRYLITERRRDKISRIDVFVCVFGVYYRSNKRMANALHTHLCESERKFKEAYGCRHGKINRGECKCQLAWIPAATEFLGLLKNPEFGDVRAGSMSIESGLEVAVRDEPLYFDEEE